MLGTVGGLDPLKICIVSSEVAPFAKTGGLADVAGALARFLGGAGHDVRVVMPLYRRIRAGEWTIEPEEEMQEIRLELGGKELTFSVQSTRLPDSEENVCRQPPGAAWRGGPPARLPGSLSEVGVESPLGIARIVGDI